MNVKNLLIRVLICTVLVIVVCVTAESIAGQETSRSVKAYEADPAHFLTLPREVLSRGYNDVPTGPLKVKTYRLERVKQDPPLDGTVAHYAYGVYHLWITGGPFTYAYTVWVDDEPYRAYAIGSDQIVVQFFGSGPNFRDGAALAVTRIPKTRNGCSRKGFPSLARCRPSGPRRLKLT